jgi:hypothetical protein
MSSAKVKEHIKKLFVEINEEVSEIIDASPDSEIATTNIMEYVSTKITAATGGYMADLYGALSKDTLNEPIFHSAENANKFYELNLRQQIADAYRFDIQDLNSYSQGVNYKSITQSYTDALITVGVVGVSAAVGAGLAELLRKMLWGVVKLPFVVVLAGAILCGGLGAYTYGQASPKKSKEKYASAVHTFLSHLETDLMDWVDEVERFYNQKVDELKKTL